MPYIINNEITADKIATIELWPYNSLKPNGFVFFLSATFALIALPPVSYTHLTLPTKRIV